MNSSHNAACLLHPSSTDIHLFSLHSDGKLFEASDAVVSLSNPVRNCTLDDSDRLWVCVRNEQEPLQCFRVGNGKVCTWTRLVHGFLKILKWCIIELHVQCTWTNNNGTLRFCPANSSKSLHAFTLQLTNQTHRDSPLLENLCKWDYFKGLIIHELCEHYSATVDL